MYEVGDFVVVTENDGLPQRRSIKGRVGVVTSIEPGFFSDFYYNVDLCDKAFSETYMGRPDWIWIFQGYEIAPIEVNDNDEWVPGEPYEFYHADPLLPVGPKLKYRCYRNGCGGRPTYVADRDTHNAYHNRNGH